MTSPFFGNNNTVLTVAGGYNDFLVYSYGPVSNASTWIKVETGLFEHTIGLAYARNRWVAVGTGGCTIAYSENGISWTSTAQGDLFTFPNETNEVFQFAFYSDPYAENLSSQPIIILDGPLTVTAPQLVTLLNELPLVKDTLLLTFSWDSVTSRFSISWNVPNQYINIVSVDPQLGFIPNSVPLPESLIIAPYTPKLPLIFTFAGNSVAASPTQWVATGSGTHSLAYSSDGINWTGLGESIFSQGFGCVWNPSVQLWVAVGEPNSDTIAYSFDGINWMQSFNSLFSTAYCVATAILPVNLFGDSFTLHKYPHPVMTSDTFSGYTASASSSLDVAFTPYHAFDGVTNGFNFWHSSDGSDSRYDIVTGSYFGIHNALTNIGFIFGEWIQLDFNQSIMLKMYTIFPRDDFETTRSPRTFVLVGRTSSTETWTVIDSRSNINWVVGTPQSFLIDNPTIEATSLRLITTVVGNIAETFDKDTVNIAEIEFYALTPSNKLWLVGGDGIISLAYSTDGLTWTSLMQPVLYLCRGIAWNGKLWVMVGEGDNDNIATSTDGFSWTGRGYISPIGRIQSVCWNGSYWIVMSESYFGGDTMAYSSDGINWTTFGPYPTHRGTVASRFSLL